ncbi:MAG: Rieske 2Fe-2S domain-containing protein [Dehalococcoidia bacterium]|nr:Rieske 2Fe-2S domain-containing protein [Dehalococcoidia bacterium]
MDQSMKTRVTPEKLPNALEYCVTRRQFLFMGAAAVGTVTLATVVPGQLFSAQVAAYDGMMVGRLSELRVGEVVQFRYPWDHGNCDSYLIKLGTPAGGGIAFNTICPHMGISLLGSFKSEHQVMGPCPSHLSTYDLTRHGMIISGHASQGLPQIVLEARGDEIYATGVMALIYGFGNNEVQPV